MTTPFLTVTPTAAVLTLAKTLVYRLVSTTVTMTLAFAATGSLKTAASFGLMNLVVNSGVYFGFEKAWAKLTPPTPALA